MFIKLIIYIIINKDTFELTKNKNDTLKVKDIYNIFTKSTHYENMTKSEGRKATLLHKVVNLFY